ncbi:MAG: phospholipid carrier-dependent glycosyltransferase [Candidatus Omnitrophota bacterium]|nr:MAG: phospholipid carrier-dependent glycosyltransferase [Candidatus Omnitrophota bacterium]
MMNKKNVLFWLFSIIALGFIVRIYNLNFPSIGYHNMKENEYLSMAEEMDRTKDFLTRRVYFYNAFEDNPKMDLYPQPPLIAYQTLLSWKLFGKQMWPPRLCNVFFGLMSIVVVYCLCKLLLQDIRVSLLGSFLCAIMPLAIYFSRNLQPESPAFFFMILGNYFYLKYCMRLRNRYLIIGGLAFVFAWLYKQSFLIGITPLLFCVPYKAIYKDKSKILKTVLSFLTPYALIAFVYFWLKSSGQWTFDTRETVSRIDLLRFFSPFYWYEYGETIWRDINLNFTLVFIILSFLGTVLVFLKNRGILRRYIFGWLLSVCMYCLIFSDYINQHTYYQMPFLGLVCITCVYAIDYLTNTLKRFLKFVNLAVVVVFVTTMALPLIAFSMTSFYRTVVFGADIAGETLEALTSPGEKVFLFTYSQGYAVARYAHRYAGWPGTLGELRRYKDKYKVRYLCIYTYPIPLQKVFVDDPKLYRYVVDNFYPVEFGMLKDKRLIYVILKEGKKTNFKDFFSGSLFLKLARVYSVPWTEVPVYQVRKHIQID